MGQRVNSHSVFVSLTDRWLPERRYYFYRRVRCLATSQGRGCQSWRQYRSINCFLHCSLLGREKPPAQRVEDCAVPLCVACTAAGITRLKLCHLITLSPLSNSTNTSFLRGLTIKNVVLRIIVILLNILEYMRQRV